MQRLPTIDVEGVKEMTLARKPSELVRAVEAIRDRPDSTEVLRAIPVVFAVGEGDLFFPPSEATRFAGLSEPGRLAVFPRSRHLPNLEQPEEFNRRLTEFLQAYG